MQKGACVSRHIQEQRRRTGESDEEQSERRDCYKKGGGAIQREQRDEGAYKRVRGVKPGGRTTHREGKPRCLLPKRRAAEQRGAEWRAAKCVGQRGPGE